MVGLWGVCAGVLPRRGVGWRGLAAGLLLWLLGRGLLGLGLLLIRLGLLGLLLQERNGVLKCQLQLILLGSTYN